MVDFAFFRSRSFVGANLVAFIVSFAMLAMFFFLALYMQNIKGYSPLQAGVRFLPSTVVIILVAPIAGRLSDRIGPRPLMTAGLLIVAGSLFWQGHLQVDTSYGFLIGAFMLMGLGMGLVMSPMSTAGMNAVEPSKAGVASGDPDHEPHGRRHLRRRRHGRAHHGPGQGEDRRPAARRCPPPSASSWPTRSAPAARASAARWATPSTRPSSTRSTTACASARRSPCSAPCWRGC